MFCSECAYWTFSELEEEWQCWNDNCIHEGEERTTLDYACNNFKPNTEQTN